MATAEATAATQRGVPMAIATMRLSAAAAKNEARRKEALEAAVRVAAARELRELVAAVVMLGVGTPQLTCMVHQRQTSCTPVPPSCTPPQPRAQRAK